MPATLTSLRIRNLALVEELQWCLQPGFTTVTGETGSGKSMIIGALKLIVGERADKSLIRTGADLCTVEAIFDLGGFADPAALNTWLEEQGVEPCEEGVLIIKRSFARTGTNRQFINASPTTLSVLKKLGESLVDLHGPHDHQSLLSTEKQLDLLDAFAGCLSLRETFESEYQQLQSLRAEYDELHSSESALERETDLLRHQVAEIETAALLPGEEEGLLARYQVAGNSRRLVELATQAVGRLTESEEALLSGLHEVGRTFRDLEKLDPSLAELSERHFAAVAELDDLAATLRDYAQALDLDPEQLAQIEERVNVIETLKRKYGPGYDEVIAFGRNAAERLHKIESRGDELLRLQEAIKKGEASLLKTGEALSKKRAAAAPRLGNDVREQLRDLGFKKAEFSIDLIALGQPGPHGLERVEFLFAPNLGEPSKPLKAIASSGEISRVMLAVKSSLAGQDHVALLVFDEIDANVGGEIAHTVGGKMRSLGERHQILCITHLPQVAAAASQQFVVNKEIRDERTLSTLSEVTGAQRVEEIARMLGGTSDSALAHAEELLRHATPSRQKKRG
ncbi:MAG TPA: DNA repair protein RecN [Chthoniobacteraceae bacterium]|nr:DNA repair protein RecN [Chthoniobacteraceae bacterium]